MPLTLVSPEVDRYAEDHTQEPDPLYSDLREETYASMRSPQMQVGRIEGEFLKLLITTLGAKRVLELGMFTGYSALKMAEGLPDDGVIITCDINPAAEAVARKFFARSPNGKKIQVRMGPALETIATLSPPLDLVFIDADKANYSRYYDAVFPLVRPGGLIVADNVLWSGKVADPDVHDEETEALRAYSNKVHADKRVDHVLLSVRDGILIARKR
jgi:caffeoyl-CoA O-methyltransferase